jgi:phenylpropionate dioxygenase-like ring-hydroxylating dioxygenase large terminal subunit
MPGADVPGGHVTAPGPLLRHWYPVGWSADVTGDPREVLLLGTRVVVWRNSAGAAMAALDRCPHRGTALSLGYVDETGCLVCPYHGWRYDGSGACVQVPQLAPGTAVPARAHLFIMPSQERHGLVWVCLADPVAGVAAFPEFDDPGYRHVRCAPYRWRTSPERMVENFTDFGHLGYLHDGLLGTKDDLVVPAHRVDDGGGALHYALSMQVPNTNDRFAVTDVSGERGMQTNRYVLTLPYTIYLSCTYKDTGSHRALFFSVQPHGDGTCTGYCYQSRDFDLDGDDDAYALFQQVLAEQDRPIVESQLPVELPLVLTEELHLSFDRVAIAYRRAMATLADDHNAAPIGAPASAPIGSPIGALAGAPIGSPIGAPAGAPVGAPAGSQAHAVGEVRL